jgi:hypothetical protein
MIKKPRCGDSRLQIGYLIGQARSYALRSDPSRPNTWEAIGPLIRARVAVRSESPMSPSGLARPFNAWDVSFTPSPWRSTAQGVSRPQCGIALFLR